MMAWLLEKLLEAIFEKPKTKGRMALLLVVIINRYAYIWYVWCMVWYEWYGSRVSRPAYLGVFSEDVYTHRIERSFYSVVVPELDYDMSTLP